MFYRVTHGSCTAKLSVRYDELLAKVAKSLRDDK
jgi:hypothetical protein